MRSGQLHDTSQVGYLPRGGSSTRLEAELKATQRHNEETYLNSVREDFGVLSLGTAIRLKTGSYVGGRDSRGDVLPAPAAVLVRHGLIEPAEDLVAQRPPATTGASA